MRFLRELPNAAASGGTAAPKSSRAAAGLVGVAALLALALLAVLAGCAGADVRDSAYFPETVSVGSTVGREDGVGWDRETVGVSFTWRLKTRTVIPIAPSPSPTPTPDTELP